MRSRKVSHQISAEGAALRKLLRDDRHIRAAYCVTLGHNRTSPHGIISKHQEDSAECSSTKGASLDVRRTNSTIERCVRSRHHALSSRPDLQTKSKSEQPQTRKASLKSCASFGEGISPETLVGTACENGPAFNVIRTERWAKCPRLKCVQTSRRSSCQRDPSILKSHLGRTIANPRDTNARSLA